MNESTFVINIGRQLGAGGRTLGHRLATFFNIGYYDKELLALAARESGLCEEIFEKHDERKGFFRSVLGTIAPIMSGDFYNNQLSDESLFHIQSEAIQKAAQEHSCVIIGRCADYVLRHKQRVVNLFISADPEARARHLIERGSAPDRKTAFKLIEEGDERRANYYNFYAGGTWGAADTYHLCINSSTLGMDGTFELLKTYIIQKLQLTDFVEP